VVNFTRAGDAVKIGRTSKLGAPLRAPAPASAVPLELPASVAAGHW
jgi:hypothetical protein